MNDDRSDLPPELASLLEAEGRAPDPSGGVKRRVLQRIEMSLGFVAGGGGQGVTATSGTGASSTIGGGGTGLKTILALIIGGGVAAGGGALAWHAHAQAQTRLQPVIPTMQMHLAAPIAVPVPPPSAPPAAAPQPIVVASDPLPPQTPRKIVSTPSRPVAKKIVQDDLGAENALIEQARAALAKGDVVAARAALDEHAAKFPSGQLAQERETLRARVP
jgi:hypothetical protein